MARLRILGNASAAPPAHGACSAYLVESHETRLLLDCGPGALPQLRAHTAALALNGIVITHMHTDHFLDLLALNLALWTEEPQPGPDRRRPIPLFLPPGGLETLAACFEALTRGVSGTLAGRWREAFDARDYDPLETLAVGRARIAFTGPTRHATLNYGVRVAIDGGLLGYTGDTAPCDAAIATGAGAELFLAECTLLEPGDHSHTHTAAPELGRMARESKCRHLLATHITRQDEAWRDQLAAAIRTEYPGPLDVVRVGDSFALGEE